jgi:CheY-like chemotaxis protein
MQVIADYRASEDRAIPLQIVALTALYTNGLEDELIALGFNAVYPKPISPADIDDIVSELLLY